MRQIYGVASPASYSTTPAPTYGYRQLEQEATRAALATGQSVLELHLKIKCDGTRPICGQCQRVPKDDPCEFTDTMSRTQELEHTVFRLQARIDELQGTAGPSLFPPASQSAPGSPFDGSSGSQDSPSTDNSFLGFQEPPFMVIQTLLQYFLPHAMQFGFFLDPGHFSDTALLPLPFGDARRPSPALLCTAYLWGVHLSQSQPLLAAEPVFLARAQQHLATDLSASSLGPALPPEAALDTIQAHVLLSAYMWRSARLIEAAVHANGAATLALAHQLHKIRSSRPGALPLLGARPGAGEVYPAPPADALAEGTRIRAFWAVAALQSALAHTALAPAPAALCILEAAEIDTPWPLEIVDYAGGQLPAGYAGHDSVRRFLADDDGARGPACMLHAQAAVLLYRAARLAAGFSPNMPPAARAQYVTSQAWLDGRIAQFWGALPPIHSGSDARILALAHALAAGASLRLNLPDPQPQAQARCVAAARAIVTALADPQLLHTDRAAASPAAGALCTLACRVLGEAARADLWGAQGPAAAELQSALAVLASYGGSPLVEYQLNKLRHELAPMALTL
ncbi:hypothetical protein B0H15DRAFT_961130 [Mycena belliarum]|uniref:Transcription factor domain-containing protein n=1 Tax=Mycena belliarum TaxID=1033014 RepID=A0AAD6XSR4_9AGAR|nr:hypothetical protein B0H15DRAFT_961130 [Mycena belliae]